MNRISRTVLSCVCFLGLAGASAVAHSCLVDSDCDDLNPCTIDLCQVGTCVNLPAADGTSCDADGLFCNGTECSGGLCDPGTPPDCSSLSDQCADGVCDEGIDACVAQPINQGNGCDDGNDCTTGDACNAGYCVGPYTPGCCNVNADCNDYNDCTADECTLPAHTCSHTPETSGTACNSTVDNQCTDPDTCDGAGLCQSNDAPDGTACPGAEPCTAGQCCPTHYDSTELPEGSFVGSVPTGMACDGTTAMVSGYGIDGSGDAHAAVWESTDGSSWTLISLDEGGESMSRIKAVACNQTTGECMAIGSISPEANRQGAYWMRDGVTGVWSAATPVQFGGEVLSDLDGI